MNKGYVAIIDYQAGNLRSVQKALEKASVTAVITSDPLKIRGASGMVFPGQGANDSSLRHLRERDLVQPIKDFIARIRGRSSEHQFLLRPQLLCRPDRRGRGGRHDILRHRLLQRGRPRQSGRCPVPS